MRQARQEARIYRERILQLQDCRSIKIDLARFRQGREMQDPLAERPQSRLGLKYSTALLDAHEGSPVAGQSGLAGLAALAGMFLLSPVPESEGPGDPFSCWVEKGGLGVVLSDFRHKAGSGQRGKSRFCCPGIYNGVYASGGKKL